MSIKHKILNELYSREMEIYERVNCDFHGLRFEFSLCSPKIKEIIPVQWISDCRPEIRISMDCESNWEEDQDSNCRLTHEEEIEYAIQRDFVGIDSGEIRVVLGDDLHNGFFNALRWIIPRKLLALNRVILHSSVMVGPSGKASVFLGHSGSGKSTILSLVGDNSALGDDMNLLFFENGLPMIEAAGIGGRTVDSYDAYSVESFYWLVQDGETFTKSMDMGQAALKFLASCPNLFLNYKDSGISAQIMGMGIQIAEEYPFSYLHFNRTSEFLNYVDPS